MIAKTREEKNFLKNVKAQKIWAQKGGWDFRQNDSRLYDSRHGLRTDAYVAPGYAPGDLKAIKDVSELGLLNCVNKMLPKRGMHLLSHWFP